MKKLLGLIPVLLLAACANNPQGGAILGAAVGGGTGAAVGHSVGGRDGAILGGVIGAAAGAAVGHSQSGTVQQQSSHDQGEYRNERGDRGDHHRRKHEQDNEDD